jgi:hypothetical protein
VITVWASKDASKSKSQLAQYLRQLGDVRRKPPPRFACNAALHYVQESVMEFATMYSNLLHDDN